MNSPKPGLAAHVLDLRKTYRHGGVETLAVNRITSSFAHGVVTAVLGPSGSGKTTLFNLLAGLDLPTSGQVAVGGHDLRSLNEAKLTRLRRSEVGLIMEDGDLVPTLSTRENLVLPMSLAGRKPEREWFDAVVTAAGLADWLGHAPVNLTPLQQQMLATARALMAKPSIVLADEPTGRVGSTGGAEVLRLLNWAREHSGQSVVLFTHDPIVAATADRVLVLSDGEIVSDLPQPSAVAVLTKLAELDARRSSRVRG